MKLLLHAQSLIPSPDGYWNDLRNEIAKSEVDLGLAIPTCWPESQKNKAIRSLPNDIPFGGRNIFTEETIPQNASLLALSFPGESDPFLSDQMDWVTRLVAYNPTIDLDASQLGALEKGEVQFLLSPHSPNELPLAASTRQEQFFCQRQCPILPYAWACKSKSTASGNKRTLFLSKAKFRPTKPQYPRNSQQWHFDFHERLSHWSKPLKALELIEVPMDGGLDPQIVEALHNCSSVVILSDDNPFCYAIAAIAQTASIPWIALTGPNSDSIGFELYGLPCQTRPIPPTKLKLREFFEYISTPSETPSADTVPSNKPHPALDNSATTQLKQIKRLLESPEGSPVVTANFLAAHLSGVADSRKAKLLASWAPFWAKLSYRPATPFGLRQQPIIHAIPSDLVSREMLAQFTKSFLYSRSECPEAWQAHFADCIEAYPNFLNECERFISTSNEPALASFRSNGEAWATQLANELIVDFEGELYAEIPNTQLSARASASLRLIKHDLACQRTVQGQSFSLMMWAILTGDLNAAVQHAKQLLAQPHSSESEYVLQLTSILSTTAFKASAATLLALVDEDYFDKIESTAPMLFAASACALLERGSIARKLFKRIYKTTPNLLTTPTEELGFDPTLYITPIYYLSGQLDFSKALFEQLCESRTYLHRHQTTYFNRIPIINDFEMPPFPQPRITIN